LGDGADGFSVEVAEIGLEPAFEAGGGEGRHVILG
jgi:hypothetical protein